MVHACAPLQSSKGLCENEYRSEGSVINKYTFSRSHHCSEAAQPNSAECVEVKCCGAEVSIEASMQTSWPRLLLSGV